MSGAGFPFGFLAEGLASGQIPRESMEACIFTLWLEPAVQNEGAVVAAVIEELRRRGVAPPVLRLLLDARDILRNRFAPIFARAGGLSNVNPLTQASVSAPANATSDAFTRPSTHLATDGIVLEGHFYAVLAAARLEHVTLQAEYFSSIAPRAKALGCSHLHSAFEIESASGLMGRGLYREALRTISHHARSPTLPTYWQLRASIVTGICLQGVGDYPAAAEEIAHQERLAESFPVALVHFGLKRRLMSLLLESERLAEADDVLEASLPSIAATGLDAAHALFLDEGIRLRLLQDRSDEARVLSMQLTRVVERGSVPRTFLAATEARCELALLDTSPEEAAQIILKEIWKASSRNVLSGQCASQMLLARALIGSGALESAADAAQVAVTLAERHGFGRDRVRALTLFAALRARLDDVSGAISASAQALAFARSFQLSLHVALLVLFRVVVLRAKLLDGWAGLLQADGDLKAVRVLARASGLDWILHDVTEELEHVVHGDTLFFVPGKTLVGWTLGHGLITRTLAPSQARDALILHLLRKGTRGETLAGLHGVVWPRVTFRSELHAKGVHALLSECRTSLRAFNLLLKPREGRYVLAAMQGFRLRTRSSLFDVGAGSRTGGEATLPGTRVPHAPLSTRESTVLELLAQGGAQSGAALARSVGLTRQSLHPVLMEMRAKGLLVFVRKGRHSLYARTPC